MTPKVQRAQGAITELRTKSQCNLLDESALYHVSACGSAAKAGKGAAEGGVKPRRASIDREITLCLQTGRAASCLEFPMHAFGLR